MATINKINVNGTLYDIGGGGISVTINQPASATNGNLSAEQLATLQANDLNYIIFNNEIFSLNDKTHTADTLTYSHVGYENGKHLVKTISITISTKAWVMNTSEIGGGGGSPLTQINNLPTPNEEEFNKHLLYQQSNNVNYAIKNYDFSISKVGELGQWVDKSSSCSVGNSCYLIGDGNETIWEFNTTNNILTTHAVIPSEFTMNQSGIVSVGTDCYIFSDRIVAKYNTLDNNCAKINGVLLSGSHLCSCGVGKNIYVIDGPNEIEKFDVTTNTLTPYFLQLEKTFTNKTRCIGDGKNVYVFNGIDILKFDTNNGTISKVGELKDGAIIYMALCYFGGNIYIFGGWTNGAKSNKILTFNTTTNGVSTLSTTLEFGFYNRSCAMVGDNAYLLGGYQYKPIDKVTFIPKISYTEILTKDNFIIPTPKKKYLHNLNFDVKKVVAQQSGQTQDGTCNFYFNIVTEDDFAYNWDSSQSNWYEIFDAIQKALKGKYNKEWVYTTASGIYHGTAGTYIGIFSVLGVSTTSDLILFNFRRDDAHESPSYTSGTGYIKRSSSQNVASIKDVVNEL